MNVTGRMSEVGSKTASGDEIVEAGSFERLRVSTIAGGVRFAGDLDGRGSLDVTTHGGIVDLRLPAALGATPVREGARGSIKEYALLLGSGEAWIEVETFAGDVRLDRRDRGSR